MNKKNNNNNNNSAYQQLKTMLGLQLLSKVNYRGDWYLLRVKFTNDWNFVVREVGRGNGMEERSQCRINHGPNGPLARGPQAAGGPRLTPPNF